MQSTLAAARHITGGEPDSAVPTLACLIELDRYRRSLTSQASRDQRPVEHAFVKGSSRQFTTDGDWRNAPADWGHADAALTDRDFLAVLDGCVAGLPTNDARIFTLREVVGLEVDEICEVLGISPDSCNATLFRARLTVRALLEHRWFAARQPGHP